MRIVETGILSSGEPGTPRAALTFPSVVALSGGGLLATLRAGSTKDSDDEAIELYRSDDGGRAWQPLGRLTLDEPIDGSRGTLKLCYLTERAPGHLIAAAMWVDRTSYPGQPLFNPATEGCLPMLIVLADSRDAGATWSPWRVVPTPDDIGPASLTSPLLALHDVLGPLLPKERIDGAYDKMIVRMGGLDAMPLRMLSPYQGFDETEYQACRRVFVEKFADWGK